MSNDIQASLLADWLEHPGTPPPPGLDRDVVQSTLSLRPAMAPAPMVSLDDILAGVRTGPFASAGTPLTLATGGGSERGGSERGGSERGGSEQAGTPPEPVIEQHEPANAPSGQVIDLASRRRRRVWGGLGLMAAAALVMITVLPNMNQLEAPATEAQSLPGAEQLQAPVQQAEPAQDYEPLAGQIEGGTNSDVDLDRSAKLDWRTSAPAKRAPAPAAAAKGTERAAAPPPPEPDALKEEQSSGRLVSSSGGASYGEYEEGAVMNTAQPETAGRSASSYESVSLDERDAPRERKDRFNLRSVRDSPETGAVADNFAYDEAAPPETLPETLEGLRSAAVPRDYRAGWYLTALDGLAYDRFESALDSAQGMSSADKARAYGAMISDPDLRIGQDMAFRAATAAKAAGDRSAALSYLRAGQGLSSLNTAQRANLYYLEGQLLEASGDRGGAMAAYKVAANLNQAR